MSELVIACSIDELKETFRDFKSQNPRFDDFLKREVMAKYVGPLDGQNLRRNLDMIYAILNEEVGKDI
jgi:hypothetical protein